MARDSTCWRSKASSCGNSELLVVDQITYLEAATATESLQFMGVGIAITLPAILGYTAYSYRVFWGKTRALSY